MSVCSSVCLFVSSSVSPFLSVPVPVPVPVSVFLILFSSLRGRAYCCVCRTEWVRKGGRSGGRDVMFNSPDTT